MGKFKKDKPNKSKISTEKKERVDDNTINYYKRVIETLNEGFSSNDDKELFYDNVFTQLEEDGPKVCRLACTSRAAERLLQDARYNNILLLLKTFSQDWTVLLSDRFGSHVLQTLIIQVPRCLCEDQDDTEETVYNFFLNLCDFLKENFTEVKDSMYASHILRAVLQVLGGVNVGEEVLRSRLSRNQHQLKDTQIEPKMADYTPPQKFNKILLKFIKVIFTSESFNVEVCSQNISPVLQTALLVLNKINQSKCQKYLKKITALPGLFDSKEDSIPVIAKDEVGSYMLEQILNLSSPEFYNELYKNMFKGKLMLYAVHPVANFILQKLITNVLDREHFEEMFGELQGNLEDLLAVNHLGLVTRLAEVCLRLGCLQEKLLKALKKAFHCFEPADRQTKIAPLLISLTTYEVFYGIEDEEETKSKEKDKESKEKKTPILSEVNYHGSVLCQKLLNFGNPKQIVASVLELKPEELKNLSCDPCGSHVVDSFFQSKNIGEKSREAFINRLKGQYVDIACNKNGSRTLEMMWKYINTTQKVAVASELSQQEAKLRQDRFGQYVHRNFGILQFSRRRRDWEDSQSSSVKKRKMFEDILGDGNKKKKSEPKGNNSLILEDEEDTSKEKSFHKNYSGHLKEKEFKIKDKKMKSLLDEVTGKKKKKK